MENAKWNGKFYTATEIAESYELEKIIRKASGRKELVGHIGKSYLEDFLMPTIIN